MNKIDKIRAEIEHRIKANKTKNGFPAGTLCAARIEVYEDLISFINSIPEGPDKSLEEEIKKYIDEYGYERGEDKLLIAIVARHFAKWQKEQMMKEAVEGRIHAIGLHNAIYIKEPEWTDKLDKYEEGGKVLVILLPKEVEK